VAVFSFYIISDKALKQREINRLSCTLSFFQCEITPGYNSGKHQGGLERGWAPHRFSKGLLYGFEDISFLFLQTYSSMNVKYLLISQLKSAVCLAGNSINVFRQHHDK